MGEIRQRGAVWWVRYYRDGRRFEESSRSSKYEDARRLLRLREGDIEKGVPVTPKLGRLRFDEAVAAVVQDYTVNGRQTTAHVQRRIDQHLRPAFGGRTMSNITSDDATDYAVKRQAAGASNAEVNRELSVLKRAYSLALKAGKLMTRPHISMLREDNVRRGFFEPAQFEAVRDHLPASVKPVVRFAYLTGWRIRSEVLPLEWRHVDWDAREVRLDPGTTKNREGRSFRFTEALEGLLVEQLGEHERLKQLGRIVPRVFHRDGAPIRSFYGAWRKACRAAGVPGRLLHDFRRSAVRNLELMGVSRSAAMAMVGHKTECIYRRYAIVDSGVLRDAATKINLATGTISGTAGPQPKGRGRSRTA
jgi:integrase